jgi:tRNA-dihydrouridine synthase
MEMSFWQQLKQPFFVLAPMDDVTDVVFRQVVGQAAAPEVYMTEFVATDGLQSPGRERTLERLRIEPNLQQPLVAQIWGKNPENYRKSARDIAQMGFAGIDINLGCPEKGIVARGCCGGLIGNNELVAEIIQATREGAPDLAISVKTRIGLTKAITEEWAGFLLTQKLDALTMHGRTVKEMSKVPAQWNEIAKVVALRDKLGVETVIIGNGDVRDRAHGLELAAQTGVDGIMIGRGVFHDLFAFDHDPRVHTPAEMLEILLHHVALYEEWGSNKPFQILKKFFKIYVNGWAGAAELRVHLMESSTPDEVRAIVAAAKPTLPEAKLPII